MCLLIVQTKDTDFTEEHLIDFYNRNRDGIGVMWAEDGYLQYNKILPANARQAVDFYNENARGKACAIHYRMRTHGDIDHENCHPYEVFGFEEASDMPMLLMHNGVLHTGNHADTSKSDTWHYIRTYLHKLIAHDPSLAFTPEFRDVIGRHIGSNRFVLMNHLGETSIVNESQGVRFRGAWMSNEYAWNAHKYMPRIQTQARYNNWTSYGGEGYSTKKYPALPLTKQQPKSKRTNNGGKRRIAIDVRTPTERNTCNGVSVDCKYLDDILEIRSLLDSFYVENGTTNKQIECMIDEMGMTKAYFAVELLGDGLVTERMWDTMASNRAEMRWFAQLPAHTWYPDRLVAAH